MKKEKNKKLTCEEEIAVCNSIYNLIIKDIYKSIQGKFFKEENIDKKFLNPFNESNYKK